jgi:uncharacterized protein with GYD domain
MPKYLIEGSYSPEGLRALASGRKAALQEALASVGGKLEAAYFAFGDTDVYVICECPDNVSAAGLSLAASSTGLVRTRTTPLLTIEETDRAPDHESRLPAAGFVGPLFRFLPAGGALRAFEQPLGVERALGGFLVLEHQI